MKQVKLFAVALATILSTTFAGSVRANDNIEVPVEVKYINSATQLPIYQLRLNNGVKGSYSVAIKDETGSVLYYETVSGAKIVRNYQFDTVLPEGTKLTFEVNDLKANTTKVYNVSRTAKVVEDVVVNEVK